MEGCHDLGVLDKVVLLQSDLAAKLYDTKTPEKFRSKPKIWVSRSHREEITTLSKTPSKRLC